MDAAWRAVVERAIACARVGNVGGSSEESGDQSCAFGALRPGNIDTHLWRYR